MAYYTALVNKGTQQEPAETFEAEDFDAATKIVHAKYPNQAFRLYLGKKVPEKKGSQAIPPTFPDKVKPAVKK